jgi:hypothetical protein
METQEKIKTARVHAGFSKSMSDRIRKEAELRRVSPHRLTVKVMGRFLDRAEAKRELTKGDVGA